MENRIEKVINIKNGKIICRETDGYSISTSFRFFVLDENGKPLKNFDFNMWDDFSFAANKRNLNLEKDLKEIEFVIEKENPMYLPIKKFLRDEESFLLDDDDTSEINQKTMQILDLKENIKIVFKNELEKHEEYEAIFDKFRIFIKNICYDGRSKLDQNSGDDTKERLINLFKDLKVQICPKEALEDILINWKHGLNRLYGNDKEIVFKIIPELEDTDEFDQKNDYHIYDVWNHIAKAVEKSKNDLDIRLALLLHDIGKPHSYQEDENGIRHFKGHAKKSAEIAQKVLKRLGYEEKQIENICFLIENHANTIDVDNVNEENLEITKKLLHIQYCDAYAYNPKYLRPVLDKLDVIYKKIEKKEKTINSKKCEKERE